MKKKKTNPIHTAQNLEPWGLAFWFLVLENSSVVAFAQYGVCCFMTNSICSTFWGFIKVSKNTGPLAYATDSLRGDIPFCASMVLCRNHPFPSFPSGLEACSGKILENGHG